MTPEDTLKNHTIAARKSLRNLIGSLGIVAVSMFGGFVIINQPPWAACLFGMNAGLGAAHAAEHWTKWRWERLWISITKQVIKEATDA